MLSPQSHAAVRKGTKSCKECRRRKVRCVRIPDEAPTCRQCQERGTVCLAQTASPRPRQTQRLPSRLRIAQLESQVIHLTKIVNNIEVKLGGKPSAAVDSSSIAKDLESDESEGESSSSDIVTAEESTHLRSLFQNDWLSVDMNRQDEQLRERRVRTSTHLLDAARPKLQNLIPSREETRDITQGTYDWLTMLHLILPQPFAAKSQHELLATYEEMCKPDVDVLALATWLLTVALTAQQVPQGGENPEVEFKRLHRRLQFSRAVSDMVESTIFAHDRLLGTLQGLGMALHFIRLQIGHGSFQKAWVRLRRVIAIAELMGLPKTLHMSRLRRLGGSSNEQTLMQKAQLWEVICNVDRLMGMMLNLPPDTGRYPNKTSVPVLADGVVQTSAYLSELTDISAKVYDLEYLSAIQEPSTKLHALALDITREVRELGSRVPASWWTVDPMDDLRPDHIVQMMHYCVIMRAHLPLALKQDLGEEYLYSRLACMDACESVARRYQFVRQKLPPGMFTTRMMDFQAFTATFVLLLTSHSWPSMDKHNIQIDKARLEGVVSQTIEIMRQHSKDKVGADFAERGVSTLCALNGLLKQEDDVARVRELTLNVPLLGKIHINRNIHPAPAPAPTTNSQLLSVATSNSRIWKPQQQMAPQVQDMTPLNTSNDMRDIMQVAPPDWQWNNLSWFIEEDASPSLFEDPLALEQIDQAALWGNTYYNLPYPG